MNNRYKVELNGHLYTISGPGERDLIVATQNLVNEQIEHLKQVNPRLSETERAYLVAFNAVADQVKMQRDQQINQEGPTE